MLSLDVVAVNTLIEFEYVNGTRPRKFRTRLKASYIVVFLNIIFLRQF